MLLELTGAVHILEHWYRSAAWSSIIEGVHHATVSVMDEVGMVANRSTSPTQFSSSASGTNEPWNRKSSNCFL